MNLMEKSSSIYEFNGKVLEFFEKKKYIITSY